MGRFFSFTFTSAMEMPGHPRQARTIAGHDKRVSRLYRPQRSSATRNLQLERCSRRHGLSIQAASPHYGTSTESKIFCTTVSAVTSSASAS